MDTIQPTVKITGKTVAKGEENPFSLKRFFSIPGLTLVLVILLGGGMAMYVHKHHIHMARLEVYDARIDNLENTVNAHEKRIAQLEEAKQQSASATPSTPALPQPSPMIPAPSPATPGTAPSVESAQQSDRMDALEKEIASLKAASPLEDRDKLYHSIRLLSSFHRFSSKVLSGKPFAAELSEFEDLYGGDTSLDKPIASLSPYADSGVPGYAVLLSSFDDAMNSLAADQSEPPAGATLWQRIVFNFTHLVTIRRINDAQGGTSVSAILGRAEAHLDVQEIQGAITELNALPESARSHFTTWLEDAQISLQAPDLLDQIEESVMQKAFYTSGAAPASSDDGTPPAASPQGAPAAPTPTPAAPSDTAPKGD
jgi:hypothetical protein